MSLIKFYYIIIIINNKNLEINLNKVKHNLMDLCILSSSYLKGSTKDFLLEDKFNKKFGKFI